MNEVSIERVELIYPLAKAGDWQDVLVLFAADPKLARACSRYQKPTSGWSFLHQAAYFGHEAASRALIKSGAALSLHSKQGESPMDVAKSRGFLDLARLLDHAAECATDLWEPPQAAHLLPSSSAWYEAIMKTATVPMEVAYGGGVVRIPVGSRYFVDSFERVLVGWHGTYNPPSGMDGEPMVRNQTASSDPDRETP